MTATLTACQSCGVELTGGADTFGGVRQELCFGCWTDPGNDSQPSPNDAIAHAAALKAKRDELQRRRDCLEDERRGAGQEIDALDVRIYAIERELDGGPRCSEEEM